MKKSWGFINSDSVTEVRLVLAYIRAIEITGIRVVLYHTTRYTLMGYKYLLRHKLLEGDLFILNLQYTQPYLREYERMKER